MLDVSVHKQHHPSRVCHAACADFNFSTNEPAFLQVNFSPAYMTRLPWEILTEKSGITRELSDEIRYWRTKGASFRQIANRRNEAVASRCVFIRMVEGSLRRDMQASQMCV